MKTIKRFIALAALCSSSLYGAAAVAMRTPSKRLAALRKVPSFSPETAKTIVRAAKGLGEAFTPEEARVVMEAVKSLPSCNGPTQKPSIDPRKLTYSDEAVKKGNPGESDACAELQARWVAFACDGDGNRKVFSSEQFFGFLKFMLPVGEILSIRFMPVVASGKEVSFRDPEMVWIETGDAEYYGNRKTGDYKKVTSVCFNDVIVFNQGESFVGMYTKKQTRGLSYLEKHEL